MCGTYPITDVVGERGGWDFGFNVGGGLGFKIGESSEFYVESRYHYVAGPEFEPPAGSASSIRDGRQHHLGTYLPLTFGFRF